MPRYEYCTLLFDRNDADPEHYLGVTYTLIDPTGKSVAWYERKPMADGLPTKPEPPSDELDDYRDNGDEGDGPAWQRRIEARAAYATALTEWEESNGVHPVEVWFGNTERDLQPFDGAVIETVLFNALAASGWRNIDAHHLYDEQGDAVVVTRSEFRFEREVS